PSAEVAPRTESKVPSESSAPAMGHSVFSTRYLVLGTRYLVPILALIVLWAGYASATQRRYEALHGIPGHMLAGGSIGQTIGGEYDGLSSIDVRLGTYNRQADPHRATLVMHLRADPSSKEDIATATLPPSALLDENGWYRFSFP